MSSLPLAVVYVTGSYLGVFQVHRGILPTFTASAWVKASCFLSGQTCGLTGRMGGSILNWHYR
jgi:hypothetical protein